MTKPHSGGFATKICSTSTERYLHGKALNQKIKQSKISDNAFWRFFRTDMQSHNEHSQIPEQLEFDFNLKNGD